MRKQARMNVLMAVILLLASPAAFCAEQSPVKLAKPTPEQAAWQDMELTMFIHFAPSTWQDTQHDNLSTPLSSINPEKLDTEQWVDVAVAMGAKQIVFVAKHVGGFCWWQTETTDYGVKNTPWRGGKGDVMKDLAESCHKRGMKLGVYLSPADGKLGIGVGGRAKTPEAQENYNRVHRQQLTELLSLYGTMDEVWFDGSNIVPVGDILAKYAPKAMIFQGPQATITWIGNEEGVARYPTWNAMSSEKARSGVSTGHDGDPDGDVWMPSECDARIRADWFWSTKNLPTLKSVDQLMGMYYRSVGHGAVLLLNQTPDTTGRIPEEDAKRAAEFGSEIQRRFGNSIAETMGKGNAVEFDPGKPVKIDHVITQENILEGERVREYVIEGLVGGEWKQLCEGTAIGHKKIDQFAPVKVAKLRLRITRSVAEPQIRRFAAYSVWGDNPPKAETPEIAAVTRTLWHWSSENVPLEMTTTNLDLTAFCKDAGVYVLEFIRTAGKDLDVQSVDLISLGHKLDKFVVRRMVRGTPQYHIKISEVGTAHQLQLSVKLPEATSRGQATIHRMIK